MAKFTSLRRSSHPHRRSLLDQLEERILLNARFIVPTGVPIDSASTFADLQTALTTAGLAIGDTIQIEPGSTPGNVSLTAPPVANLTIQGDPNVALATIPQFTFSNVFVLNAVQGAFTLKNLNIGFINQGFASSPYSNGSLRGTGNYTITNCNVVDINSSSVYPIVLGGVINTITNSTFTNITNISAFINVFTPGGGSNNLIAKNTFVINPETSGSTGAIIYTGGADAPVSDQILSNAFTANPSTIQTNFFTLSEAVTGLIIHGNTFSDLSPSIGVYQTAAAQNLSITNNSFNLGSGSVAIYISVLTAGTTVSATIANNQCSTAGSGIGLVLGLTTSTTTINFKVQGNDFHGNNIGVKIQGSGPSSGVDLGGGPLGSLGGNDFRSFGPATATSGALILPNVKGAAGALKAQKNLFAPGSSSVTLAYDPNANLDLLPPLFGKAAFVQSLYQNYLHRTGDTTNPADAAYWINLLNADTLSTAEVANSITHSTEALGALVDGLYQRFLGRAPDSAGRAYFIGILQQPRGVETAILQLLTSPEFTSQFGSDGNFIQALYTRLLGRIASNADVAFWLSTLPNTGRTGVINGILASAEFRTSVLQQFYGFTAAPLIAAASVFGPVLHRATVPTAPEISYWLSTNQDILTLNTTFAQTTEFYNFG